MRKSSITFWVACVALLVATGGFAQTTGTIEGVVVDEQNQALPGVTVEVSSPNLQGTKVAVTDTNGGFRFPVLPPGVYAARFSLAGFGTREQTDVNVSLGRVVTIQATMQSAFEEEVVITGGAPFVDTRSTEMGANLDSKYFLNTPTQRNFASIIMVAPGAVPQGDELNCPNCVSVYGSTGAENAYYIDGVNTTGVEFGTQGKVLNFEFVQEAQIKTGSYNAEFGRATGGVINVITKSGGNSFSGEAFGYFEPRSWGSDLSSSVTTESALSDRSWTQSAVDRQDFGLSLGGYFVKDKLWFYGAYNNVSDDQDRKVTKDYLAYGGYDPGFPDPGAVYTSAVSRDLWSAKLTWRASDNHSLIFSGFGDPSNQEGPIRALAGNEQAFLGQTETGGTDVVLKYEGILGDSFVLSAMAAQHKEQTIESGAGFPSSIDNVGYRDYTHPIFINTGTLPIFDGYAIAFRSKFGRDMYRADGSYFLNDRGGDHELKFGAESERVTVDNETWQSRIRTYCQTGFQTDAGCPAANTYYQHEYYLTQRPPGDTEDPTIGDYYLSPLTQDSKSDNLAAYLQDSWRISPSFTLNLGLRWEQQKLYDQFGEVAAKIDDNYAHRVGFVWDWGGTGTSKLYGSYGRFFETIPMDMVIRSFGGEISVLMTNDSPDPNDMACDPAMNGVNGFRRCRIVGTGSTPVDPALKGQYIDEIVFGAEHEIVKDWVVGGRYIWRDLGRVIEDALSPDENYYIGNPGTGYLSQSYDQEYVFVFDVNKPKRTFTGFELNVRKRFSNNWQMMGSYLWSKLEGNYDGTFQAVTGQLDPNLNSAFDYAEFQMNNTGYLSVDRRHQFKVSGSYSFPFGLNLGLSAYYMTGTPITAMGYSVYYRNWEFYLSERGAFGRTADVYEADLHLGYPVNVGDVEINLLLDVFNLLDRQGEVGRSLRYTILQDYDVMDYDTGEVLPPITQGDAERPPTNPSFDQPNQWQYPRSIRFGVRVNF